MKPLTAVLAGVAVCAVAGCERIERERADNVVRHSSVNGNLAAIQEDLGSIRSDLAGIRRDLAELHRQTEANHRELMKAVTP